MAKKKEKPAVQVIGFITKGSKNVRVMCPDGSELTVPAAGFPDSVPKLVREEVEKGRAAFIQARVAALTDDQLAAIGVL